MRRVAIIGASGMLGKELLKTFRQSSDVVGTYARHPAQGLSQLDVTSPPALRSFLQAHRPDVVIYSAALTDLERCESHPEEAQALNALPLETISEWADSHDAQTVLISTDGVFDGTRGNYSETDATNPLNVYGRTKLQAERIVASSSKHLILRVAVLYGADITTKKFLGSTIAKLGAGQRVYAATDLIRSPTLTDDIARATQHLIGCEARGIYHVAGSTTLNMFDAAKMIAQIYGYDPALVNPISSADLLSAVPRPKDCSLDTAKLNAKGFEMRRFEDGLRHIKMQLGYP